MIMKCTGNYGKIKKVLSDNAMWVVLALLVIVFTIINPAFIKPSNVFIMLRQVSIIGITAVGMMFVILLGEIDLSVGSTITFVNIICAYLMVNAGVNMWIAIPISMISTVLIGLVNGFMVATIGIPSIIATFASQTVLSGLALKICGGIPISGFPDAFRVFGQGYVFGVIPVPVLVMVICFAAGSFILNKTYFGRFFYAVGGNSRASELSGIAIREMRYLAFALSGFFAGLAGIEMLSRTNSGMGNAGVGYEFKAITCVVLGGVSVTGGYGSMSGVIAGTCIIGVLQSGMVFMNLDTYSQNILLGIVLACAVGFDCIQRKIRNGNA